MSLDNEQARLFHEEENFKQFLLNPYRFCEHEEYRLSHNPVSFTIVDKAVFPPEDIRQQYPLDKPTLVNEPIDKRRVRALIVDVLERNSLNGNTLLTLEQVLTAIHEMNINPECPVTRDNLRSIQAFIEEEVELIHESGEDETESIRFYQLVRLKIQKEVIRRCVEKRVFKGKLLSVDVDWQVVMESKIGVIDVSKPEWWKKKEKKAREEKSAALKVMAAYRFSVLNGPAGTGKTRLLNLFCDYDEIRNQGILKLAPTGKARVKLGVNAKTIAQFLIEYDRYDTNTGRYYLNPDGQQHSGDRTVIIDESSMLTEDQLAAVIDCLVDVDRIILVGDPRQLPPIGTGRPFADIIERLRPESLNPDDSRIGKGYTELNIIFRQSDDEEPGAEEEDRIDLRLSKWFSDASFPKEDEDIFKEIDGSSTKEWGSLKFIEWYNVSQLEELILKELKSEEISEKDINRLSNLRKGEKAKIVGIS
ncbi:MAG: AAA family ATPase [Bacteroidetes bacterium]|nr:AAA family ATPase [Bacteroidota bacterium]